MERESRAGGGASKVYMISCINRAGAERFAQAFKALGNPLRFEIMKYLVTHPGDITGDLVTALPIAQATVSQQLAVLRAAGVVTHERKGNQVCYRVTRPWLRQLVRLIAKAQRED